MEVSPRPLNFPLRYLSQYYADCLHWASGPSRVAVRGESLRGEQPGGGQEVQQRIPLERQPGKQGGGLPGVLNARAVLIQPLEESG